MKIYGQYGRFNGRSDKPLKRELEDDIKELHNAVHWRGYSSAGYLSDLQNLIDDMYKKYIIGDKLKDSPEMTFKISDAEVFKNHLNKIKDCADTLELFVNKGISCNEWATLVGDIRNTADEIDKLPIVPKSVEYIIDASRLTNEERFKLYKKFKDAKLTIVENGVTDSMFQKFLAEEEQ